MKYVSITKRVYFVFAVLCLSISVAQAATFQVKGVKSWDSLNMRAKPGVKSVITGKIPANGKDIYHLGDNITIGRTSWLKVRWQGKVGWVSQHYLQKIPTTQKAISLKPPKKSTAKTVKPATSVPQSKGKWVLECGNLSPFWKVIVHPKALQVNLRGKPIGMLPITYEKQDRNRWNTAMKTVLKSANNRFNTNLTIKYTKQCFHTLSKQNVHYRVNAFLSGEALQGCCKAVRIQ